MKCNGNYLWIMLLVNFNVGDNPLGSISDLKIVKWRKSETNLSLQYYPL